MPEIKKLFNQCSRAAVSDTFGIDFASNIKRI